jgi:hypothetical protein
MHEKLKYSLRFIFFSHIINLIFKYIRVQSGVKSTDIIQYLYSNDGFKLKRPKIIFSIVGGAKQLNMPSTWKKDFKSGLIKSAKAANAWIITGGLNTGVMRLVGDAVSEAIGVDNVTLLGITTWGSVENADALIVISFFLNIFVWFNILF